MMQVAPIPEATPPCLDVVKQVPAPDIADETPPSGPPILQDLAPVDRLLITKRLRVKSVLFLRGKKNRFFVRTPEHSLVYVIEEENSWWVGYFFYGLRPLKLRVTNDQGVEVMCIQRPYACTSRVLPCQLQRMEVQSPPGNVIGSVEQQWTPITPLYIVKNDREDVVFWIRGQKFRFTGHTLAYCLSKPEMLTLHLGVTLCSIHNEVNQIKGPTITVSLFRDVQFRISRADGTPVGSTCKRWQGLAHSLFVAPVADKFGVAFERDLSVDDKGLLLAATLLINYMYYDV